MRSAHLLTACLALAIWGCRGASEDRQRYSLTVRNATLPESPSTATLTMAVDTGGAVSGYLAIQPPLGGSGLVSGRASSTRIELETVSNAGDVIKWSARVAALRPRVISGTYVITEGYARGQTGIWSAALQDAAVHRFAALASYWVVATLAVATLVLVTGGLSSNLGKRSSEVHTDTATPFAARLLALVQCGFLVVYTLQLQELLTVDAERIWNLGSFVQGLRSLLVLQAVRATGLAASSALLVYLTWTRGGGLWHTWKTLGSLAISVSLAYLLILRLVSSDVASVLGASSMTASLGQSVFSAELAMAEIAWYLCCVVVAASRTSALSRYGESSTTSPVITATAVIDESDAATADVDGFTKESTH